MWTYAGVLALVACASALTRDQFYPHGPETDQTLPRGNDVPSHEHVLRVPIKFYGETYESIFVNNFGVVTFRADIPSYLNIEFPLPYPSIAVFYSNIDTTNEGVVYYRETSDSYVLSKAEESVQDNFHDYYDFQPRSVFIVTWLDVTYTSNRSLHNPKNSFQVAIISNGTESFAEFLYPERDIQWIEKDSKIPSLPDAKAQAGFISEDGRIYELRGSGSHQIRNVVSWSNTHEPGKYVFRIGDITTDGNIAPPDQYNQNEIEIEEETKTCAQSGPSVCHIEARCVDYSTGICCQCKEGYYGNGKSCIKNDIPLRVHGKINGVVNHNNLNDIDIQAYVVVSDGRAYTALSLVPSELGSSLQLLNVLGGVVGWLFAKPSGLSKNGYQLTGSIFNHTADIFFPNSGDRITINQEYLGHDVFDQITLETDIRGSVPVILTGTKLEIMDFEEQYTLVEPGRIRSQSSRTFINKVTGETIEQRVSQTFTFSSCQFAPPSEVDKAPSTLRMSKNYLGFETRDNIVRYGMTTKIYPLGHSDPCIGRSNCAPHSTCVSQGDSYECVCQSGFASIYQDGLLICLDVDECQVGTHNCDINADCFNHEGGFQCRCRNEFIGNGVSCKPVSGCDKKCDDNAQCVESNIGKGTCVCNEGYIGDGHICLPSQDTLYTESEYNESFVLPNCDALGCTCPLGYSDYRDNMDNHLCRLVDYTNAAPRPPNNQYEEQSALSNNAPTESYYQQNTDSPYLPPTEPPYSSTGASHPLIWDSNYQTNQENYQQNNYNQNSDNNYPPESNYESNADSLPSSVIYNQEHNYEQSSDNEYQQSLDNNEHDQRPDDANYQQPSDNNYRPPPENSYQLPSQNNYEDLANSYQQTSERSYEQTPNYQRPYKQNSSESTDESLISCQDDADCPPNAICADLLGRDKEIKHCICPEGYEGDAFECIERTTPSCDCGVSAHCVSVGSHSSEYICVCDPGYQGDGYICRPNFSCKNNSDCEYNAECQPEKKTGEYTCQCVKGFVKDQNDACIPDAQLCNGAWCAEHASCLYDPDLELNYCHCDNGFSGDGISHCAATSHTCDIMNDCSPSGVCTFFEDTYICICKDGYNGDGYTCTPESSCRTEPQLCDIHASCLKNHDIYVCECNAGYNGNGSHCELNARPPGKFLVASDGASVYKVPLRVTDRNFATPINSAVSQIAVGIDVDCSAGEIYWGDVVSYAIKTSRYDGSDPGLFIADGIKSPEGIAIDWAARNIFWTDSKKLTIEVANLDTKVRKVLFAVNDIFNPRGIAVHPQRGKIFWSDWKRTNPKIEWANMDGSQRGLFLDKNNVALPNSLAIDWVRDRLCYADAGLFSIKCVNIDNLQEETIATNCSYPFGLAIYGDQFFWTDWKTLKIESYDVTTQIRSQVPIATASRRLYGVAVAPDQCPQAHSACLYRNGGCGSEQLCLPNGNYGRTCVDGDKTFNQRRRRNLV